jgi:hypothetical protein
VDQFGHLVAHSGRDDQHKTLELYTWTAADNGFPDPSHEADGAAYHAPNRYYQDADEMKGYAPLILTLPGEPGIARGDVVAPVSTFRLDPRTGARAVNASSVQRAQAGGGFAQVGPNLPDYAIPEIQAVGGHRRPTFYVGVRTSDKAELAETDQLLVSERSSLTGAVNRWHCVVPGPGTGTYGCASPNESGGVCQGPICHAYRFFADPYDPNTVYALDEDGVKETDDGGHTWHAEPTLTNWILDHGATPPRCVAPCSWGDDDSPLLYIIYTPSEPRTRFAMGINGLLMTPRPQVSTNSWIRAGAVAPPTRPGDVALSSQPRLLRPGRSACADALRWMHPAWRPSPRRNPRRRIPLRPESAA